MKNNQKEEHAKREQRIKQIADSLCELLIKEGFIVQRYDAYSTNSIYLKLDCGLCNSIRISDHEGKKHLSYMYNVRGDINHDYRTRIDYTRYYVSFKHYKRIIQYVKENRWNKWRKAGSIAAYNDLINIEKNLNKNNKGFWEKAYLVNKI